MQAISTATSGLLTSAARFDKSALQTVQDAASSKDLVSDFVDQKEAQQAFQANISVIKAANSMTGSLLNIRA